MEVSFYCHSLATYVRTGIKIIPVDWQSQSIQAGHILVLHFVMNNIII